jgi:hypothetical protein
MVEAKALPIPQLQLEGSKRALPCELIDVPFAHHPTLTSAECRLNKQQSVCQPETLGGDFENAGIDGAALDGAPSRRGAPAAAAALQIRSIRNTLSESARTFLVHPGLVWGENHSFG